MKTLLCLTTLLLGASTALASNENDRDSAEVLRLEPVVVQASRLPTVQELSAADLETSRQSLNQRAHSHSEIELSRLLAQAGEPAVSDAAQPEYTIVPASSRVATRPTVAVPRAL